MICRRLILTASMSFALSIIALTMNVNNARAGDLAEGAENFIRSMSETAIQELTAPDITRDERKLRLKNVIDTYFYVPGIGQWVLGRFWRQASVDERKEYIDLFGKLIIESYVDKFASYTGESLEIIKTDVRKKDAIVSSTLKRPDINQVVQLEWRVRVNNGVYKIIDIMVEGISMGQTQRSEFASAIKNNGGNIGKFLDDLRARISPPASPPVSPLTTSPASPATTAPTTDS